MEITVREMVMEDCQEVSYLQCASFRDEALRCGFSQEQIADYCSRRGSVESMLSQLQDWQCRVACLDGVIAGVIAVQGNEIGRLYVDPLHFRKGIGSRLFTEAQSLIAAQGHKVVFLTSIFPGSLPFYGKMGMKEYATDIVEHGPMAGVRRIRLNKRLKADTVSGEKD